VTQENERIGYIFHTIYSSFTNLIDKLITEGKVRDREGRGWGAGGERVGGG